MKHARKLAEVSAHIQLKSVHLTWGWFSTIFFPAKFFQKAVLGIGPGTISILNLIKPELIATIGETTGYFAEEYMSDKMKKSSEGEEVLTVKPRINSQIANLKRSMDLPEATFDRVYADFQIKIK